MADIRYPVGESAFGAPISAADRLVLIAVLADAPASLRSAVKDLVPAQLDSPYRPGGWTIRQVVHHLADAHMNWYVRTKVAVTEGEPTIKPYHESLWAELDDARSAPIELSLAIFDGVHRRWVQFFESLTQAEWSRRFHHPERGTLTVEDALAAMAWHSRHHTAHITELRKRMEW